MSTTPKAPPAPSLVRLATAPLVLALLVVVLGGCAGEGGVPTDPSNPGAETSFATLQSEVFDRRCVSTTCHAAGSLAGGLSLASEQSYDALVNVEPQNPAAVAEGMVRVMPNDPERSFLLRKLTGDLGPGEGSPMPLGGALLSDDEIEMIRAWIEDGAPRDASPTS